MGPTQPLEPIDTSWEHNTSSSDIQVFDDSQCERDTTSTYHTHYETLRYLSEKGGFKPLVRVAPNRKERRKRAAELKRAFASMRKSAKRLSAPPRRPGIQSIGRDAKLYIGATA